MVTQFFFFFIKTLIKSIICFAIIMPYYYFDKFNNLGLLQTIKKFFWFSTSEGGPAGALQPPSVHHLLRYNNLI